MDAFSYTDIFDTKGIEYLVVIAFLLTVVPVWFLLSKPVKEKIRLEKHSGGISPEMLRVLPGLLYSRKHTWAHLMERGAAKVGVSDLLLHLTGGVSVDFLKKEGEYIAKGEEIASLASGGRELRIKSPVSGEIIRLNHRVEGCAGVINADPYDSGWILQLSPSDWKQETAEFYLDKEAIAWSAEELKRCKDFLAQAATGASGEAVLQAGGELMDFPLGSMPDDIWKQFQKEFLD